MNRFMYLIKTAVFKITGKHESLMRLRVDSARARGVRIGDNVRLFSPIDTTEPYLVEIGRNVTISSGVRFVTHDNSITKIIPGKSDVFGKIKIGDNCFIGLGAILLPGVELGDTTIVGAGSVVTRSFPEGNIIIAGNPAKKITDTLSYRIKVESKAFDFSGVESEDRKDTILAPESTQTDDVR
ncbi:acyltransferase [Alicyclobacillus acidiphilus]|uniref:acyltransferase n=2 Tax=Alicyclobacillus acidiphilus TaxID=182455 RepID=UPI002892F5E6|nr:acyltransferase [Alicyclobacillus acidiphilus]